MKNWRMLKSKHRRYFTNANFSTTKNIEKNLYNLNFSCQLCLIRCYLSSMTQSANKRNFDANYLVVRSTCINRVIQTQTVQLSVLGQHVLGLVKLKASFNNLGG